MFKFKKVVSSYSWIGQDNLANVFSHTNYLQFELKSE